MTEEIGKGFGKNNNAVDLEAQAETILFQSRLQSFYQTLTSPREKTTTKTHMANGGKLYMSDLNCISPTWIFMK